MQRLTPRERRVLELMAGTLDGHRRSIEEVAARFGVDTKRIQHILALAKRKLNQTS